MNDMTQGHMTKKKKKGYPIRQRSIYNQSKIDS